MKEEFLKKIHKQRDNYCKMAPYIEQMPPHIETIINALGGSFKTIVDKPFTPYSKVLVYIPSLDPDTLFIGGNKDKGENEWLDLKDGCIISDVLMRSEFYPGELWCVFEY